MSAIAFPHIWVPRLRLPTWAEIAQYTGGKLQHKASSGKVQRKSTGKALQNTATDTSCCCSCTCGDITYTVEFSGIDCPGCYDNGDGTSWGLDKIDINGIYSAPAFGGAGSCVYSFTIFPIVTRLYYEAGDCTGASAYVENNHADISIVYNPGRTTLEVRSLVHGTNAPWGSVFHAITEVDGCITEPLVLDNDITDATNKYFNSGTVTITPP